MPALVMFLLGVITDAATGLSDKIRAAARMVSLGYEDLVPDSIRQHLPGHAGPVAHPAAAQHVSTTAVTDGGGHGWLWIAAAVLVVLALYLRPAITARLAASPSSSRSTASARVNHLGGGF